jgi:4-aminobutyrate aminotransferase-like enzyme
VHATFAPPLTATDAPIDRELAILDEALTSVTA